MRELDKKKLQLQLIKADAAIAELEYKIEERKDDIERMREHIQLQEETKQKIQIELERSK